MKLTEKISKEATISFIGMGFGQMFRYFFTTLLARWAGMELLGIYSISNAVTRISEVIGKLGLDQGVLRTVSKEQEQSHKQSVIRSALKMGLIFAMVLMLGQIIIAGWLATYIFHQTSVLSMVLIIHALSLPFCILIHISAFSTQAYKLLKHKIFVNEIQNPLILFLAMVVFYFSFSTESAIMLPVVISSVFGLFTISISLKKVSGVSIFSILNGKFNRNLFNYSIPIMFMSILGTLLHWTDVFMLGYFTDTSTVGLYHPAARTAGIIRMIIISFTGIYGPIIVEMYARKSQIEMEHIFKLITRWVTTFSLPFAILILIYPKKVMLIFGSDFIIGYPILMILVIAAFIQAVFGIGGTTLNMTGFPKINLINTLFAFGLNIGLNIILIPNMGGVGAALATLSTLGFIAIIRGLQNWKILHLTPWSKKMLKPIIAGIFTIFTGYYLKPFIMSFHTVITLLYAGIIIFVVFFTILWMCGFDEDDKGLLAGIKIILGTMKQSLKLAKQ